LSDKRKFTIAKTLLELQGILKLQPGEVAQILELPPNLAERRRVLRVLSERPGELEISPAAARRIETADIIYTAVLIERGTDEAAVAWFNAANTVFQGISPRMIMLTRPLGELEILRFEVCPGPIPT
jgi:hypothetical protein